jgi:hypothetical protein
LHDFGKFFKGLGQFLGRNVILDRQRTIGGQDTGVPDKNGFTAFVFRAVRLDRCEAFDGAGFLSWCMISFEWSGIGEFYLLPQFNRSISRTQLSH